jgi:HlyD family secretion protein
VNKKMRPLLGLIVIGCAAGLGYWWYATNNNAAPETALTLYGNVDIREARLAFNGSEHVGEILVQEGDQVQAGQLLAVLHAERLQASLDKARADVVALKAEARAAALSYQRVKSLAAKNLASAEEAELADAKSRAAAAHVAAAEAGVVVAEQALKDTRIYAPVAGIIRDRIVEPGDFVTPQNPVLTLALANPVWVRTYLPESYLGKVKPGTAARITTDSYAGKTYEGWVGFISPTAEFTPKNIETPELRTRLVYQMRVFVCNPQYELRLGMPATVSIDLDAALTDEQAEQHCAESSPQHAQQANTQAKTQASTESGQ